MQDLGRRGQLRYGIPPSGPVDPAAFVANRLVGNADGAAGLECTVLGPRFEVGACAIAVTGAEMPITVNGQEAPAWTTLPLAAGDVVKLGAARTGSAPMSRSPGIDVPEVLGSRSTYLGADSAVWRPRALQSGRAHAVARAAASRAECRPTPDPSWDRGLRSAWCWGRRTIGSPPEGLKALLTGPFEMLPQSDRMERACEDIVSPTPRGTISSRTESHSEASRCPVTASPSCSSWTASLPGATKVATVCSFDLGRLGQVKPGQRVRFQAITLDEAHRALREARIPRARAEPKNGGMMGIDRELNEYLAKTSRSAACTRMPWP